MTSWLVDDQNQLQKQLTSNTLPHAIIFSGVQGAGKLEIAQWLTNNLLCQQPTIDNQTALLTACKQCKTCHLISSQTHPDHSMIELKGSTIGVDQIRTVSRFFEKTAQLGQNQVVIINDAEKMTESAANALLKTLEEPTTNSFIMLLVKDTQRLLPTIISRCYQIKLSPPVGKELLAQLGQQSNDAFINLSHLSELTDPQVKQQFQRLSIDYINFLISQNNRMGLVASLLSNEQSIRWLEKITVDLYRDHQWKIIKQGTYLSEHFEQDVITQFINKNVESLWVIYKLISNCSKKLLLLTQVNKEYCLEKLLVDITNTIKANATLATSDVKKGN